MIQDTYLILWEQKFLFLFNNSSDPNNNFIFAMSHYAMHSKYFISFSSYNSSAKGILSSPRTAEESDSQSPKSHCW